MEEAQRKDLLAVLYQTGDWLELDSMQRTACKIGLPTESFAKHEKASSSLFLKIENNYNHCFPDMCRDARASRAKCNAGNVLLLSSPYMASRGSMQRATSMLGSCLKSILAHQVLCTISLVLPQCVQGRKSKQEEAQRKDLLAALYLTK